MAQDEKMLRLIRELAEKGAKMAGCDGWRGEAMCGEIVKVIDQALSAAPAQPAPLDEEAAGERFAYVPLDRGAYPDELIDDLNGFITGGSGRCRAGLEDMGVVIAAHPSPPADDDRVRVAARALLDACVKDFGDPAEFEGDDGAVASGKDGDCAMTFKHMRDLAAALKSTPPADDALRVAVEALTMARTGYCVLRTMMKAKGLSEGYKTALEHIDTIDEALAALKAGGVK